MKTPEPFAALSRYRSVVDDWPGFIDSVSRPLPGCLWVNRSRVDAAELAALITDAGFELEPLAWNDGGWRLPRGSTGVGHQWWFLAGLCHSQEEASMLPVRLLDPQPGERVLDLCAAPGGKTAQIALALAGRGSVIANDVNANRLRALRGNLERLGAINVSVTVSDGTGYPPSAGAFDAVLVDAPCSAQGTVRKTGYSYGTSRPEAVARFEGRQRGLLERAVALCRPGGRIVYSTCSLAPEENELIVDAALAAGRGTLEIGEATAAGFVTAPGLCRWEGRRLHRDLALTHRVWPHLNDTGGFYVALLRKRRDADGPIAAPADPSLQTLGSLGDELHDRYGIAPASYPGLGVARRSHRGVYVTNDDHRPPARPLPQSIGLRLFRDRAAPPKLSTAGAMWLGSAATRNVVELDPDQPAAYLRREGLGVSSDQLRDCDRRGPVIVRHLGHGLGIGWLDRDRGRMASLFPKRWMGWQG